MKRLEELVYTWRRARTTRSAARRTASPNGWEESLYSQNGEDGILRELLFRAGFVNRYFVEFGAGDGSENNTTLLARHYGWSGLYIEGDAGLAQRLSRLYASEGRIEVVQALITRENICEIFAAHRVPQEFDLLSIDVDGNDYWIWEQLHDYRARVVVVEYNAAFPPPRRWVMQYNASHRWDGTSYYGASLESFAQLGKRLGYALVCTDAHGVNAFFVRDDLMKSAGLQAATAAEAYHPLRYGLLGRHHPSGPERPYVEV